MQVAIEKMDVEEEEAGDRKVDEKNTFHRLSRCGKLQMRKKKKGKEDEGQKKRQKEKEKKDRE